MWVRFLSSLSLLQFIIAVLFVTHGFAQASTVRFVDAQGETIAEEESIQHEKITYLPVDILKSVLDPNLKSEYHRPRKQLTLKTKGKLIQIVIGKTSITIDPGKQTYTI